MNKTAQRVLLVGATGLVGSTCLARLRASPRVAQIIVLQRRAATSNDDARVTCVQTDFANLDALPKDLFEVDAVLCALGSTIRQAGSQVAFRRVDHDYALAVATRAYAQGAGAFGLVSALGADPGSRVFYNRVKGETENDIAALGFTSFNIVRPSLLLGARTESRLGELLFAPLGGWLPARWRSVPAERVAAVLVEATLDAEPGVHRIENAALFQD